MSIVALEVVVEMLVEGRQDEVKSQLGFCNSLPVINDLEELRFVDGTKADRWLNLEDDLEDLKKGAVCVGRNCFEKS